LRYLEKGSESSFSKFCTALLKSDQRFLISVMDANVRPRARGSDENKQELTCETAECSPVSCTLESLSASTAETAEETGKQLTEIATESTQGFFHFIV